MMDDVSAITDKLAFCNPDNMLGVESFTYWPKGGTPKTVSGPVTRDAIELQAKYGIAIRAIVVFVSKQEADERAGRFGLDAERFCILVGKSELGFYGLAQCGVVINERA